MELVLPDLLLPQVSQLLLHPGWLVGIDLAEGEINFNQEMSPDQVKYLLEDQEKILHNLRKAAKKTRYNMVLFTQFYANDYSDYLKKIKAIQEVLGVIQDCFVLRSFLKQALGKNTEQYLPTLIQHFHRKRYQQWQAWESLQHQFLKLPTRQQLQKIIIDCASQETT